MSVCLSVSVCPKYLSSTIATAVLVRYSSKLKFRSHIWQRRLSSINNNTGSSERTCASIYFRFCLFLGLCPRQRYNFSSDLKKSNLVCRFILRRTRTCYFSGATKSDLRACACFNSRFLLKMSLNVCLHAKCSRHMHRNRGRLIHFRWMEVELMYLLRRRRPYGHKVAENGVTRPTWPQLYRKTVALKSNMTSDFKPEVVLLLKLRIRSEKSPLYAKNSVGRLTFLRHTGNRCRWIHFWWEIYDRK